MAERRMFAKTIVLSDAFLDLPMSARCLYFTLGMLADDDGFVNSPKSIMRQCGASEDDMKVLLAKKFLLWFDTGVIVIKHWRINNYLRNDRYTETKYVDEKSQLVIEPNGAYQMQNAPKLTSAEKREVAYKESDLPYSFSYKIRHAFNGRVCPVCGCTMQEYEKSPTMPTIQHNTPISKGGQHVLSNISVICKSCNITLQDTPTGDLNNAEVVEVWNEIVGIPSNGIPSMGIPSMGIPSIGIPSIDKDSLEKNRLEEDTPKRTRFTPPTVDEVSAYCKERKNTVDAQRFVDFYASKGWKVGNQPMKDWKAAVRTWEQRDRFPQQPARQVTAQQYTQRDYTEDELEARASDLMTEAMGVTT